MPRRHHTHSKFGSATQTADVTGDPAGTTVGPSSSSEALLYESTFGSATQTADVTGDPAGTTVGPSSSSEALLYEGVNLASGAFGYADATPWKTGTVIGDDYEYSTNADIDYFVSKGMNTFRLATHAQHLTDATKADDLQIISNLIDYAGAKGATVILDLHDFGYTATGKLIGHDVGSVAEFASEWSTIANYFKDKPNVVFDIMNEPHNQTATEWLTGANAAIQAIRDTGATQKILVPGSYWDGAWTWTSSDNDTVMLGIKDPLNNYAFEVHQYLDHNGSGDTTQVDPGAGSTRLKAVTDWARSHDVDLFLGEFGFAPDSASMAEGKALNDFTHANSDVWIGQTYWAAGPGWGEYFFSVEPTGLGTTNVVDAPQMSVLDDYLI